MIETKEQYEMLKRVLGPPHPTDIQEEELTAFVETIEALREMARAAEKYVEMLEYCAGGMIAEFGAKQVHSITQAYEEARDALSDWITDK